MGLIPRFNTHDDSLGDGMKNNFSLVALCMFIALILAACGTNDTSPSTNKGITKNTPVMATSPIDVQNTFIAPQALEAQAVTVAQGNLFENGGFENGLTGWTACAAGAIATSSDALEGAAALQVNAGNCFYRSVTASAGQKIALSCNVKLLSGAAWTGMGFNFTDASFATLSSAPTAVATSNSYTRLDTVATAPANTQNISMWLYSDNPAVVDNCSLLLETEPPPPPPSEGANVLENSLFEDGSSNVTTNWSAGCAGTVERNGRPGPIGTYLVLSNGACLDQGLSSNDIAALAGRDYTFSCNVFKNTGYAALTLFIDGQASSEIIPVENTFINAGTRVSLTGTVPSSASSGFVSIYGGTQVQIDDCRLEVEGGEPPPPPPPPAGDNLLVNGDFSGQGNWSACSSPDNFALSNGRLNISGQACVYQTVEARANQEYTLSCSAKLDTAAWSSMILSMQDANWTNITETNTQIDSTSFSTKELKLTAPSNAKYVGVTFYAEGATTYESCTLTSDDVVNPPEPTDPNLVGHWTFDEGTGSTANDISNYGNTAIIENGGWGAGKIAGALAMNGGDDSIVSIPLTDSLRGTTNTITVMAWGYRTANHNVALISHGYPDLFFGYHGPQYKWQIRNEQGTFAECYAGNAPLNEWQHVAATFNGSTAKLYANGVEICSRPLSGSIPMRDLPFLISGYINTNGQIIDEITGKIDDVRIYDRVLNGTEIQEIYNSASN